MSKSVTLKDGTRIAYRIEGSGQPLVLTNGLTTSTRFWDQLRPVWLRRYRVLTWDLPGHGLSGPANSRESARIEAQPAILAQVMTAAGLEQAVQVAWSTGCQVALEMMREHADRCSALVLLLGGPGRVLSTSALPVPGSWLDWAVRHIPDDVFSAGVRVMATLANGPGGHIVPRRLNLIGPDTHVEDARVITEHLTRIDPPSVQTMIRSAQEHSAHDLLGGLDLPVLIVCGDRDPFSPSETVGIPLHAAIADSELVRLPRGTHTALLDHAPRILHAVEDFLNRRVMSSG